MSLKSSALLPPPWKPREEKAVRWVLFAYQPSYPRCIHCSAWHYQCPLSSGQTPGLRLQCFPLARRFPISMLACVAVMGGLWGSHPCVSVPICPCVRSLKQLACLGQLALSPVLRSAQLNGLTSQGKEGSAGPKTDGTKASALDHRCHSPGGTQTGGSPSAIFNHTSHTLLKHIMCFIRI